MIASCLICKMNSTAMDASGGRVWANSAWTVNQASPPTFIGNLTIFPNRHVPTELDLSDTDRAELVAIAELIMQESENQLPTILEELGIPEFSLEGFGISGVETGHYHLWLQPQVFVPSGFISVREKVGDSIADRIQEDLHLILDKYRSRIASSLLLKWGGASFS
jgi:hypothetical protein